MFEHVAVADRRARERKTEALQVAPSRPRSTSRGDDPGLAQPAVLLEACGDHRQQLVAATMRPRSSAMMTRSASPSRVNADIGAHSRTLRVSSSGAVEPTFAVMFEAVGLDPDRDHLGAELPQGSTTDRPPPWAQSTTTRKPSKLMVRGSVRLANSM